MTLIEKAKEALKAAKDELPELSSAPNGKEPQAIIAARLVKEALDALETEKLAEDVEDVNSASWAFMSITEMDEGFTKRRERMKILIGRRDERIRESYHAKKCAECPSTK